MVRWRTLGLLMAWLFMLMASEGALAETAKTPDIIQMKAPYEHTRGIMAFTHQKHVADYKIGCGDCHHNDQGKPLTQLKAGEPVQKCIECHKKPGEIKGKEAKGLSEKEKLAYHGNAVHENCIGCHKKFNKEKGKKSAPTTCKECHGGND